MSRLHATLHPDNHRSTRLLENLGFEFEGRTKRSLWVGDDNTDVGSDTVTLVEITPETEPTGLPPGHPRAPGAVRLAQHRFLAHARVPEVVDGAPVVAWFRTVEADGDLVGFVMLVEITEARLVLDDG